MMRGKSYLGMGGISMGIAGSMVDLAFFENYLGMRVESVDMSEFIRRMERGIYDAAEFNKAHDVGQSRIAARARITIRRKRAAPRAQLDREWEISVKMALMARDLMAGNPRLAAMGRGEEAHGHNAIAAGFQGQRQWTDHMPNGDFMEAILNTSFDWNGARAPYLVATENDALNGAGMLLGYLLTNTAQIFADVRTYWSPAAVKRVTGRKPAGAAAGGFLHLINSGPAALDGTGEQSSGGRPAAQTVLGNQRGGDQEMFDSDDVASLHHRVFPGRRLVHALRHPRRHARDDLPAESGPGPGAGLADRGGPDHRVAGARRIRFWTSAPIPPGRRPGLPRARPARAPSAMFIR